MKKKKMTLAILLACSMMAGLVGCGGSDSTEAPADASGTEEASAEGEAGVSGEDLKVMIETPVESIDP